MRVVTPLQGGMIGLFLFLLSFLPAIFIFSSFAGASFWESAFIVGVFPLPGILLCAILFTAGFMLAKRKPLFSLIAWLILLKGVGLFVVGLLSMMMSAIYFGTSGEQGLVLLMGAVPIGYGIPIGIAGAVLLSLDIFTKKSKR